MRSGFEFRGRPGLQVPPGGGDGHVLGEENNSAEGSFPRAPEGATQGDLSQLLRRTSGASPRGTAFLPGNRDQGKRGQEAERVAEALALCHR